MFCYTQYIFERKATLNRRNNIALQLLLLVCFFQQFFFFLKMEKLS